MALPAPTIFSHQPGEGSAAEDAACAEGDSPVNSRMALSRASFSSPQVSYATRPSDSAPPRQNRKGSGSAAKRVAGPSVTSESSSATARLVGFDWASPIFSRGDPLTAL